jgi:hypothetical protein
MLKFKFDYQAVSAQEYDQRFREREIRYLQRRAAKLGFTLSPSTTPVLAVSQQSPRLAGPAFNPQETGELVTSAAWYNL